LNPVSQLKDFKSAISWPEILSSPHLEDPSSSFGHILFREAILAIYLSRFSYSINFTMLRAFISL
jgi:hypothetical protein